jgi:hypothetical protein
VCKLSGKIKEMMRIEIGDRYDMWANTVSESNYLGFFFLTEITGPVFDLDRD